MAELESTALKLLLEGTEIYRVPPVDAPIKYEGGNKKKLLVLCRCADALSPAERELLEKILAAVKMSMQDIALIAASAVQPFHALKKNIEFTTMLAFGFKQDALSLNIHFIDHPFNFCGVELLFTESLATLLERKDLKAKLWMQLQAMFKC